MLRSFSPLALLLDQCNKAAGTQASAPGGRGLAPSPTPGVDSPGLSSPHFQIEVFHNAGRRLQRESHMYAKPFKCESQTQSRCNFLGAYWSSGGQYTLNFHILAFLSGREFFTSAVDNVAAAPVV